jgi:hypothetical protein
MLSQSTRDLSRISISRSTKANLQAKSISLLAVLAVLATVRILFSGLNFLEEEIQVSLTLILPLSVLPTAMISILRLKLTLLLYITEQNLINRKFSRNSLFDSLIYFWKHAI